MTYKITLSLFGFLGWTLLFQAARAGSLEVVKWLVEELNADPSLEVGGRPAEKLADTNGHIEVAKYLRDIVDSLPNPVRQWYFSG